MLLLVKGLKFYLQWPKNAKPLLWRLEMQPWKIKIKIHEEADEQVFKQKKCEPLGFASSRAEVRGL